VAKATVKVLNFLTRVRRSRCRPGELLVLLASCLQCSECKCKIVNDVAECARCGRCKMKDLLELVDRYGCRCMVTTGGRLALQVAKSGEVAAIVAVACEKELREGMMGVFPKPTLGVINLQPHGPCKDTDVDLDELERAIKRFLE
jgi:hypothetical protein